MDTPTAGHNRGVSRQALDSAALLERLRALGFTPFYTDATGSTNTDLVEAVRGEGTSAAGQSVAENNAKFYNQSGDVPHLSVLLAEEQIAGRGRMGRPWSAPKYSQIITSVVLRLQGIPADSIGLLPLLTGMAIAQGVRVASAEVGHELPAELKWPNDVLIEGRKLAGILVEAAKVDMGTSHGGQASPLLKEAVVVLGFGVNYDLTKDELPVPHATSIAVEAAHDAIPTREQVIFHILENLARDVERFTTLGGAPESIMGRYRQLSATIGKRVKAFLPGEEFVTGQAVDIDKSGELMIKVESHEGQRPISYGQRLTVAAGDVEHLRSADTSRTSVWGYA